MTSVVGITALQELRKFKGFENAIIAGGFVRDSIMGGTIKDLDIFVPVKSQTEFVRKVEDYFVTEKSSYQPAAPKMLKFTENDFQDWIDEQIRKGDDPWDQYDFEFDRELNIHTAVEKFKLKLKVTKNIGNFKELVWNKNGYKKISPKYIGRYDCKYMDFLDVDIVGYLSDTSFLKDFNGNSTGDFGPELVSEFSYDIDKVYFNGTDTIQTSEFKRDFRNHEATLCKLSSISDLPHAMRKFERLREKYPDLLFRSTVLDIKTKEKDQPNQQKYYTATTASDIRFLNPFR